MDVLDRQHFFWYFLLNCLEHKKSPIPFFPPLSPFWVVVCLLTRNHSLPCFIVNIKKRKRSSMHENIIWIPVLFIRYKQVEED